MNYRLLLAFTANLILFFSLTACYFPSTSKTNVLAASYNTELGLGYFKQGDRPRAKAKLLLALQQNPKDPLVQDAMGYFMEQTGQAAQAEIYYRQALAYAPNLGIAQNNYGTFLCRQKRYTAAIQHFFLAVNDPNYLHPADAFANAGVCAMKIPDPVQAKRYFQQALAADPKHTIALFEIAKLSYNHSHRTSATSAPEAHKA